EAWWTLIGLVALPILVVLNGFFVAAEFALVAVRKTRIEELVSQGISGANAVKMAVDDIGRSIAATQLGVTLCSIALGWVAEQGLAQVFDWIFEPLATPAMFVTKHAVATTIAFVILTFCHVIFGEMVPKSLALQSPDRFALWLAKPLAIFVMITRPAVIFINASATGILK